MASRKPHAGAASHEIPLFGRYRVQRLIGRGGFASVYRAEFLGEYGFRKPVALKVLRRRLRSLQELASKDFLNEARLGASIRHRNLVEFYECGRVGDRLYIAMELVEGPNLQQVLEERSELERYLDDDLVLAVALHTAHGLKALHEAAIDGVRLDPIHQDMKPGNILLSPEGQAKLTDYGIARFAADFYETLGVDGPRGSPPYMSPEQTLGERLTQASDVWSYAAMIVELATGTNPFLADSVEGILERIRRADPGETLDAMWDRFPLLVPVLQRCLVRDPAERIADGTELVEALRVVTPPPLEHELVADLARTGYERVQEKERRLAARPVQVFWGDLPEETSQSAEEQRAATDSALPDVLEDTLGGLQITAGKLDDTSDSEHLVLVGGIEQPAPPAPRSTLLRALPWAVASVVGALLIGFFVVPGLRGGARGGAPEDLGIEVEDVVGDGGGEAATPAEPATAAEEPTPEERETPTPQEPPTAGDGVASSGGGDARVRPPASRAPTLQHTPIRRGIRGSDTAFTIAVDPGDRYRVSIWYRAVPGGSWQTSTVYGGEDGKLSLVIPAGPWFDESATAVDYWVDVEGPGGLARSGSADAPHHFRMY